MASVTEEQTNKLRAQVDRLRRERNDARADAMRWLEEHTTSLHLPDPSPSGSKPGSAINAPTPTDVNGGGGIHGSSNGVSHAHQSTRSVVSNGNGDAPAAAGRDGGGGSNKSAAVISKLKSKVERLRKERDEAEIQAAKWLSGQQDKMRQEMAESAAVAAAAAAAAAAATPGKPPRWSDSSDGGGGGERAHGPVVSSLKAESLSLKKQLDDARCEAQRWKDKAAVASSFDRNGSFSLLSGGLATPRGKVGCFFNASKQRLCSCSCSCLSPPPLVHRCRACAFAVACVPLRGQIYNRGMNVVVIRGGGGAKPVFKGCV